MAWRAVARARSGAVARARQAPREALRARFATTTCDRGRPVASAGGSARGREESHDDERMKQRRLRIVAVTRGARRLVPPAAFRAMLGAMNRTRGRDETPEVCRQAQARSPRRAAAMQALARSRQGRRPKRGRRGRANPRDSAREPPRRFGHVRETSRRVVRKYWKSLTQKASGHIAPECVMGLSRMGSASR